MTTQRRDGTESAFSLWVRNAPELGSSPNQAALSITDVDYLIHQYMVWDKSTRRPLSRTHMLLLELKCFGAAVGFAQHDTLRALDQLCSHGDRKHICAARGERLIFYHGLHILRLSGDSPRNSEWMKWDERMITVDQLINVLRFRLDAWSLQPREDRTHHRAHPVLCEDWVCGPEQQ